MSIDIDCYFFCFLLSVVKTVVIYVAILISFHSCSISSPTFGTLTGLVGLAGHTTLSELAGLPFTARLVGLVGLAGLATLAYSGGGSDADTRECVDRVS